jgi:hypothetical protein
MVHDNPATAIERRFKSLYFMRVRAITGIIFGVPELKTIGTLSKICQEQLEHSHYSKPLSC